MNNRFGALRFLATFCRVLAWIGLVGGILFGLATIVMGALGMQMPISGWSPHRSVAGILGAIVIGMLWIVGALMNFVILQATSDYIHVGLSIEENTRHIATYLKGTATTSGSIIWERPQEE